MGRISGQMVENLKDIGKMANRRGLASTTTPKKK